jgi:hypothetical protein
MGAEYPHTMNKSPPIAASHIYTCLKRQSRSRKTQATRLFLATRNYFAFALLRSVTSLITSSDTFLGHGI